MDQQVFQHEQPDHRFFDIQFQFHQIHHRHDMQFLWKTKGLSDGLGC